ncbi:hypothetical protein [Polaribacter uvawellassae]|uniref:hypothetical protein n=1 Tax=Polaribacter uvawellassae TaxID=3133495 RepID=UPI00321BE29B
MKKTILYSILFLFYSCTNYGQLTLVSQLSSSLKEVSGNEMIVNSNLIWMLNDSGNTSEIFGVNQQGKLTKVIKIEAVNNDWEDLTSDEKGNLYIGDFGNNNLKRENLRILKITNQDLLNGENAAVESIEFEYPQVEKKKNSFDAEAFFYFQNYFYIFTKSRKKKNLGSTLLFKVPNKKGKHIAEFISKYEFCNASECRITAADISKNGKQVALLNHASVFIITTFNGDDFFSGELKEIPLEHTSQKEGINFKDENTLFITDERVKKIGGNLYSLKIKP